MSLNPAFSISQSQSSTFHQKTQSGLRNPSRAAKENLPKENLKATTSRKLQVKPWPVKKVSLKTSEILGHTFSLLEFEICPSVDHTTPLGTQTGKPQETVAQSFKCYSSRILGYLHKDFFLILTSDLPCSGENFPSLWLCTILEGNWVQSCRHWWACMFTKVSK